MQTITTLPKSETAVKWIEINGTRLAYIEKGTGEPVVFIHGAVSDYRTWSDQFDFFSRNYRVISYSRRYHQPNKCGNGSTNYSRAAQTADLIAFLKGLNLKKAHLIGHSYGASIALMAALQRPELIGSLVLAEPSPFPSLLDEKGINLLSEQRAGFEEAIQLARSNYKSEAVRQFLHTIVGIDVLELLPGSRRSIVLENADTLEPMLKTYYESPRLSRRQLKNVKIPTLFVTGELSPKIARLNNEAIDRCLPNSKIAILRGASHGLQMENPDGFNKIVFDFLSANRIS